MASARPPGTTSCSRCGAHLSAPPGARSVRCALCHAVTRVERRPQHGGLHQAVGFIKGLFNACASPPSQPPPSSSQLPSSSSGSMRAGHPCWLPASYPAASYPLGGRKLALLVGISYSGTKYELKGAVNVNCMSDLLRERFGFPSECIFALTQEDKDPNRVPTKANLLRAMHWLVEGCASGDSLVFHFSGHGVQKLDNDGDDVDGYDEALCPLDFEVNGVLLDDEINKTIVRPLGPGVQLHAIVDTSHSGTILDLPYLCRISRTGYWQWENHSRLPDAPKGTSGGLAISFGCRNSQTSADTTAFSGSTSTGAITYSFIKAVESGRGTTYGRLLSAMRATIRDNGGEFGVPGSIGSLFGRVMITFSRAQEPRLCASEAFDIYKKPFLL